jgi:hypothetical protein
MNDPSTPGVLLKSEDGSHYFIPYSDLSQYAEQHQEVTEDVAAAAPRVDALSVSRSGDAGFEPAEVAFPPFPEH